MAYRFDKASILVVEDLRPVLLVTVNILKIFGFKTIYTAREGEEAFTKFRHHNPDIVLTDWQIEPFDGIELTRRIRTDPQSPNPYVPVILMTGYSARLRVMEARDTGITEFLVKPFTSRDLFARLEQLVERPRDFVDSQRFFGPDRRRRVASFDGPSRRDIDPAARGKNKNDGD